MSLYIFYEINYINTLIFAVGHGFVVESYLYLHDVHTKACALADAVHISTGRLFQIWPFLLLFFLFLFHLCFFP